MVAISEIGVIHYAGNSFLRREFLEHVAGDNQKVIALGGGIELKALHPLLVAQGKIESAQKMNAAPDDITNCYVAFDTLTYVPTITKDGLLYEVRGKPESEDEVQRLLWEMRQQDPLPYRIRSASALRCGNIEKTAWHDASITLSYQGLTMLTSDSGLRTYASHVKDFGYQCNPKTTLTDFAAGLNLETLLALGCVDTIDGVHRDQVGFKPKAERALFLATVGASHQVIGPITHNPMNHIVTFPHHLDLLALLGKYTGVT